MVESWAAGWSLDHPTAIGQKTDSLPCKRRVRVDTKPIYHRIKRILEMEGSTAGKEEKEIQKAAHRKQEEKRTAKK